MVKKIKFIFLSLLVLLPAFASQILSSHASYGPKANIESKKRVTYKEIRQRKHSKKKPNLKNQVGSSCSATPVIKTETLPSGRRMPTSVYDPLNNKIYVLGGYTGGSLTTQITEYDPSTGTVTTKAETLPSNTGPNAIWSTYNNKIYLFGGTNVGSQIVEYDPATGTVTTKSATLPAAKNFVAAVWNPSNNKAYLFGGFGATNQILEYDPSMDTLTTKAETLPSARWAVSAVFNPLNNKIYIFGGTTGSPINEIVEYDPSTGTVTTKAETLPIQIRDTAAVWNPITNKAYIVGGDVATSPFYRSLIFEYDPATGIVITRTEGLPTARHIYGSAVWYPTTNKIYAIGGTNSSVVELSQIVEYTPCASPTNPTISSVNINGVSQAVASSYRITAGQTFVANVSSTDSYPGNKVTISCNPPAGRFTPSPTYIGTGRFEFTPTAADVGNTYSYTFTATSDSGAVAASTLTFTVAVSCSPPDNGCTNGNICVRGSCCTLCQFRTGICASDPSCVFIPVSQPVAPVLSPATPVQTPIATPALTVTPSATPSATATPVQNITNTNNGSTTNSQGTNVSPPQINTTAPSVNIQKPSVGVIDASIGGIVKPQNTPTATPFQGIDISKYKPSVKTDSALPYIDFSEQK